MSICLIFNQEDRILPGRVALASANLDKQSVTGLLESLPDQLTGGTFRLQELLDILRGRSMAAALLLAATPQVLPLPLFLANVLALPLVLLSAQILMGREIPWLPKWMRDRPIRRSRLEQLCRRMAPILRVMERFIRPRMGGVFGKGERLIGLAAVVISLVAVVPLPLAGWLPGWSLVLIALGLLERDGLLVLLGVAVGAAAVGVLAAMVLGLVSVGEAVARDGSLWRVAPT